MTASYTVEQTFSRTLDVPLVVPQLELMRNDSLVLSTVSLKEGETLRIRWINLTIYRIDHQQPEKLNSGLGLAYVGLFGPNFAGGAQGWPVVSLSSSTLGTKATNPWDFVDIKVAGVYGIAVVNNTSNADMSLSVGGIARHSCASYA